MNASILLRIACAAALVFASASALATPSNKWRLEFSGAAESPGEMVFSVTPVGGMPTEVTVAIEGNDGENRIAGKVRTALKAALKVDYKVSVDDGEDVLIKKRGGRPDFDVALVSSTVKSVRVNFDRE